MTGKSGHPVMEVKIIMATHPLWTRGSVWWDEEGTGERPPKLSNGLDNPKEDCPKIFIGEKEHNPLHVSLF